MSTPASQSTMVEKDIESQSEKVACENVPTKNTSQSKFMALWLGEWKEETRIPFWHPEFRQTRRAVAKEWVKTSELES
jgi:hypothetical protein